MHDNRPIAFVDITPNDAKPTRQDLAYIKHFVMVLLRIPTVNDINERKPAKKEKNKHD